MRRHHGRLWQLDRNHSGFHPSHQNNFLYIHLFSVERETYGTLHSHKHKQMAIRCLYFMGLISTEAKYARPHGSLVAYASILLPKLRKPAEWKMKIFLLPTLMKSVYLGPRG